jgi:hypothetical protein
MADLSFQHYIKFMKILKSTLFTFLAISLCSFATITNNSVTNGKSNVMSHRFYQLKIYSFNTLEQVQGADDYFKQAFIPSVNSMGIANVGVFKPISIASDSLKKIYVLIPFSSMDEFINIEEKLEKSQVHNAKGSSFLNAPHNKPAFSRYESIILRSFDDFPSLKIPKLNGDRFNRIYELRSFESSSDKYYKTKVHMFNEGGEAKLFEQLKFNSVFYDEVVSGPKMPNLMYMTTFTNLNSRDEHWDAFRTAPELTKIKSEAKYENSVSHADIILMYPTDYSNY